MIYKCNNRYVLFFITCLIVLISTINVIANDGSTLEKTVKLELVTTKEYFSFGSPIGISLTVSNKSSDKVACDICENYHPLYEQYEGGCEKTESYPINYYSRFQATNIRFLSDSSKVVSGKNNFEDFVVNRPFVTSLEPETSWQTTFFLNKYLTFKEPGDYLIEYKIETFLSRYNNGIQPAEKCLFQGEFYIRLKTVPEEILDEELKLFFSRISLGKDQENGETLEALCSLDTPLLIKYLAKLLEIKGCELPAIRSLSHFKSPEATQLLVSTVLRFRETNIVIVQQVLNAFNRNKIIMDDEDVLKLLSSDKIGTICATIEYLGDVGGCKQRSLIEPFLNAPLHPEIVQVTKKALNKLKDENCVLGWSLKSVFFVFFVLGLVVLLVIKREWWNKKLIKLFN